MKSDDFSALLERITKLDKIKADAPSLRDMLSQHYGIENVVYLGMNIPGSENKPLLTLTYTPEWQKHYAQRGYIDIDPVVRVGLGGILPIDWNDINRANPLVRQFFEEAKEMNIGRQGLSLPLRGRHGDFALFSVTTNDTKADWQLRLPEIKRDIMTIAWNFHAQIIDTALNTTDRDDVKLSQRELLCLRWKALGKTESEIGEIIGISARTVRFHLEGARARLRATNITHAVSKALSTGIINLWYESYENIRD
jgi:DNA-binding CsgD family transcriptional regulator